MYQKRDEFKKEVPKPKGAKKCSLNSHDHKIGDEVLVREVTEIGIIKKIFENGICQIQFPTRNDFICGLGAINNYSAQKRNAG